MTSRPTLILKAEFIHHSALAGVALQALAKALPHEELQEFINASVEEVGKLILAETCAAEGDPS